MIQQTGAVEGEIIGYVDVIGAAETGGWALRKNPDNTYSPVSIDILMGDKRYGPIAANLYRADIAALGWGDGHCGFVYLPSDDADFSILPEQIKVFCAGTDVELTRAKRTSIPLPALAIQGYSGSEEFIGVGEEFKRHLIGQCGLTPDSRFLDIGCGIGRMARCLAGYLSEKGLYRGFDVAAKSIAWCRDNIAPLHANFDFKLIGVHNELYSPRERRAGAEFKFPYESNFFDAALAASVFTHLFPDVFGNYMKETARVLKPGGKALITAYLINSESRYMIKTKQTKLFTFGFDKGPYRYEYGACPEAGLAYEEGWVIEQFEGAGLRIDGGVRYGMWCGRKQFLSYQDIFVVTKE